MRGHQTDDSGSHGSDLQSGDAKANAASVGRGQTRMRRGSVARLVAAFSELLDDLPAERRQVVWLAAGDDALVGYHLLVHHLGAGVAQVGPHAGPGGHAAAAYG